MEKIVGMARRPFDPGATGWAKTVYHQGDITDRGAVDALAISALGRSRPAPIDEKKKPLGINNAAIGTPMRESQPQKPARSAVSA